MRNPRDFGKPLAIGAPEPVREIPFKPSRMIHFFDPSNEKMAAKLPELAAKTDILLGNLEDAIPADQKVAGARRIGPRRPRDRPRRHPAVDARQQPRVAVGTRRSDHAGDRDRRHARRDHDPEGRGSVGHPLRRPPAGAARGQGGTRAPDPRPRDPRDRPRRDQRRGDRDRQPADAGDQLRSGGPGRFAAHEDHPRRRRPPGYRVINDPDPDAPDAPRPTAQQDPWHYSIARMVDACTSTGILPFYGPFGDIARRRGCEDAIPGRVPARLRRRVVAASGPDRHRQEGLQPDPTRCCSPRRCSRRSRTGAACT